MGDRRPHLLPEQVTGGGLEDECVSNMSCGCRHTLVTTEEGEVFSWGLGRFGVLGRSYTDFTYNNEVGMAVPEGEEGHDVPGVAAQAPPMPPAVMDAVVAAAEEDGQQLNDMVVALDALNLVRHLRHEACSVGLPSRNLIFSVTKYYSMAHNALYQTLDDPSDQCYPKLIESLKGFRAIGVSAGHRHSMVLDEHGGLYTFGSGAGALGHGDLARQ